MINLKIFFNKLRKIFGGYKLVDNTNQYIKSEYRYCCSDENRLYTSYDDSMLYQSKFDNKKNIKKDRLSNRVNSDEIKSYIDSEYSIVYPADTGPVKFTDKSLMYKKF